MYTYQSLTFLLLIQVAKYHTRFDSIATRTRPRTVIIYYSGMRSVSIVYITLSITKKGTRTGISGTRPETWERHKESYAFLSFQLTTHLPH